MFKAEAPMSEAWMMELLASVRDTARAKAMPRLAEHLDDAILIAASELHEALEEGRVPSRHDGGNPTAFRVAPAGGLH
jgi:DNA-binding transcriptional ArsR family regulator